MQHDWEIWLDNHFTHYCKMAERKDRAEVKSSYFLKFDHLKDLEIYSKAKKAGKINPAHLLN